jgi:predicted PurR-regulated permease PerM
MNGIIRIMPEKIEISHKTIIFTVLFLLLLLFLYIIKDIIFLVFVAFIMMSALRPLVEGLERFHFPRLLSIFCIYVIVIALLAFSGSVLIPPLVAQSLKLGENFPEYLKIISPYVSLDYKTLSQQLAPIGQNILHVTITIFSDIIGFFTVIVISFYMLIERKNLDRSLSGFMGKKGSDKITGIIMNVEDRLGAWVRGQATLGITIGIMTAIGLSILGLPYVLPLSIFAGLLEAVPNIGPIVSAIPAILIALTISPLMGLVTALLYFVIQQAENHLIVPFVMKKVVGLPPLVTMVALLVGAKLAGIPGALLGVPVVVMMQTIISEYIKLKTVNKE